MSNHIEKGINYWENGDYELALYCFKDAKNYGEHLQHKKPDSRKAYLWNLIGICNYLISEDPIENEQAKIREALDCFKNAAKLADDEPIYWRNYALLLYWSRNKSMKILQRAKKAIEKSINRLDKIDPLQNDYDIYEILHKINQDLIRSIDVEKIPKIIKIFSKFDQIQITKLADLLKMEHGECLEWLISLPDTLGFKISNNDIKINHREFKENKFLLEDRNTSIMKIDISLTLEPNPILQ